MKDETKRYWVAINGASAAATMMPLADPHVSPIPEQLIGFPTQEEQLDRQRFMLEAPMDEVRKWMSDLVPRIKSGEVRYIRPTNPKPPTRGATVWSEGPFLPCEHEVLMMG